jgi:hypothetical protein
MPASPITGFLFGLLLASTAVAQIDVTISIDLKNRRPISELIYGANHDYPGWKGATIRRWGGNSSDTYNWENNFNNAGHDYINTNTNWQARTVPAARMNEPAAGIAVFHEESLRRGVPSIVTVPLVGYVAADADGAVSTQDSPPSKRWKKIVIEKGGSPSPQPDLKDDVVYLDEMVNYLVRKFGPASSPTGIKFWAIGNEPGLWTETHPLIWKQKPTCSNYVEQAIAAARMIKRIDPSAQIIGPSGWSIAEFMSFSDAPDWPEIKKNGGYRWYADYFLDEFRKASEAEGHRLLDVLSVNLYAEEQLERNCGIVGVLQGPRSLWQTGYYEASWIGETLRSCLPMLPRIRESIDQWNPGTRYGITEFDRRCTDKIEGGIATADTLGVMIDQDAYLATAWPLGGHDKEAKPTRYAVLAYRLYRDFDGKGAKFGDRSLTLDNPDPYSLSAYASIDSKTGELHVILLHKNLYATANVTLMIGDASAVLHPVAAYGFDGKQATLSARPKAVSVKPGVFTVSLPRLSATHLVFSPENAKQ